MPPQYLSRSRQRLPSERSFGRWFERRAHPALFLALALFVPLLLLFPRRVGGVLSGRLPGPHEGGPV